MINKINILGTDYTIIFETKEENEQLLECKGYADFSTKEIHINKETYDWYGLGWKTLKHEIVHCFIFESGLWNNCSWADNEELTDWIAIQTPKLLKCFESLEDTAKSQKQLAKAKALLAKWVELYKPKSKTALPTPIQVNTEQFLKEIENE